MPKTIKLEIEVTEPDEKSMFFQNFIGDGECSLGNFSLGSIIPTGQILYQFENVGGVKRRFYIDHKQMIDAIEKFIASEK